MRTILELLPQERTNFPFESKNNNAIVALVSPMYRESNMDISFGVRADAVAEAYVFGQLTRS